MMKLKTNQNFTKSPRTKIKKWIKSKEKINWEAGLKIQRVGQENQWEERKVGGEKGCQYKTGCSSMMHDVQGQRGHQDESKTTLEAVV
jgi:hypothetical protein